MLIRRLSTVILIGILVGCAGRESVILLTPDKDGDVGAITLSNQTGIVTLDKAGAALRVKDDKALPKEPDKMTEDEMRSMFGQALELQPFPPVKFILYFQFDSPNLTDASQTVLAEIVKEIQERDSKDIAVIGHTDRAGEPEYNLKLSYQRAKMIKDILVSNGVNEQDILTTSYGEADLLIPTADNVAEPKNRRVEVVVR